MGGEGTVSGAHFDDTKAPPLCTELVSEDVPRDGPARRCPSGVPYGSVERRVASALRCNAVETKVARGRK